MVMENSVGKAHKLLDKKLQATKSSAKSRPKSCGLPTMIKKQSKKQAMPKKKTAPSARISHVAKKRGRQAGRDSRAIINKHAKDVLANCARNRIGQIVTSANDGGDQGLDEDESDDEIESADQEIGVGAEEEVVSMTDDDEKPKLDIPTQEISTIETKVRRRILQKELSLTEKVRLIKEHRDHKKSLRILASEFNIGKSTVSGILKRRDSIQREHDNTHNASDRCRKKRHTETELINDLVWKWYQITKSKDTPLSGPKIKTKARDYATDLGYDKFKASNGWLDTFKKTHGIRLPVLKIYGAVRELKNGGQRTRRSKSIEGNKRRQRQISTAEVHNSSSAINDDDDNNNNNNSSNQWTDVTTGIQNTGTSSVHIPQIFEPEVLLQARGTQASATTTSIHQGYSHSHLHHHHHQQQQQQQPHHHHHHQQHQAPQQQQQQQQQHQHQQHSLQVQQSQHSSVGAQVLVATQWNSSADFQQPPPLPPGGPPLPPPPQPPQPPQQQHQQQQQQQQPPSEPPVANNGSHQVTGAGVGGTIDNSPQQMMNNLAGMYNYAMSKNDHSLANQVLHLKAAFEASIIHDRFATSRRQPNNGSYFW